MQSSGARLPSTFTKTGYFGRISLRVKQSDQPSHTASDEQKAVKPQLSHKVLNQFHNAEVALSTVTKSLGTLSAL